MIDLSYIAARGCQKSGMQGVGKRPRSALLMARLHEMMLARLREMGLRA